MRTPVADFARQYADSGHARLHMPGHKGKGPLGAEALDLTEITGADSLYEADGIIRESEKNASSLFGSADTFYGTEGSSQCIRAMLYLVMQYEKFQHPDMQRLRILAARGAHKALILAAALLDLDITWLWPEENEFSLCRSQVDPLRLQQMLGTDHFAAVYITSPDYLGDVLPVSDIASVCHRYEVPLIVDNAHGAYLRFTDCGMHPLEAGADLCCDSAHKTLPVLTGGAYLHIGQGRAAEFFKAEARDAMALFGSTSPSYLILQSLDLANAALAGNFREDAAHCIKKTAWMKACLKKMGWQILETEPLKVTVLTSGCGYTGKELLEILSRQGIECEYADPDFLVMMTSTGNDDQDFERVIEVFRKIPVHAAETRGILHMAPPKTACTIREAVFARTEVIDSACAAGRVLAAPTVSCPPAVPVCVSGEVIREDAVRIFEYYGIQKVKVIR